MDYVAYVRLYYGGIECRAVDLTLASLRSYTALGRQVTVDSTGRVYFDGAQVGTLEYDGIHYTSLPA